MRQCLNCFSGKRLLRAFKSPTFVFFILAVVVMTAQMVITSYKLAEQTFYPMPSLRSLALNHLCDTLLFSAFYWLLAPRRRSWFWLLIVAVTVWCFGQITYNETYQDMMPFSSWLYVSNVGEVLIDSILGTITLQALWILSLTLLLLAVYVFWLRKRVVSCTMFCCWSRRWLMTLSTIMLAALLWFIFFCKNTSNCLLHQSFVKRYCSVINFKQKVYPISNGNVAFIIYSVSKAFSGVDAEQMHQAQQYLKNEVAAYNDNPYCTVANRNLVLLMVESLNAWVVNLEIDGREVCPVLNSLVADSASISCTQMMAQVKNGRSSDGMFIYNTGLLPLPDGSVAMDYGENQYPSLSQALKGVNPDYCTMEITVDRQGMWNVEHTAASYGFDSLYLQDAYRDIYIKSGQSIDKTLLEFASAKLASQHRPFYSMIFTGTTHIPYSTLSEVEPTWISKSKSYTLEVRNYLEKVAFFDRQLGSFLERLKRDGIYDNTVVVIASDHSDFVDSDPRGRASISKRGIECVFVILNSGLSGKRFDGPVGQIDIYPTILDIMGANSYWWKGQGYSLLRTDVVSASPAPGESIGDSTSPMVKHQLQSWSVATTLIKTNWWDK